MDIAQYISDLLTEHQEISLAGIGTFVKQKATAYFDESEGLHYPPSYKINLNPADANATSALLIQHIIASKHISESSALYFIERFCDGIKSSLDNDGSADISPLGRLSKTDNAYTLELGTQSQGAEFFGLKPVKEPEILIKSIPTQPIIVDEDDDELEEVASQSNSQWLWVTILILVLLGGVATVAYIYNPQYFNKLINKEKKAPTKAVVKPVVVKPDTVVKDSLTFADSILNQLEKEGMQGSEVKKAQDTVKISTKISTPRDTVTTEINPKKVYEIIIASFGLKNEAEASVRNLRKKGIDAKVVLHNKKPKFKVSVGTFPTMQAASKELKRIQQDLAKDAWILTVINKDNQ